MKTVSGKVESSMPISLSRAARYLSKFAASDNGASQAFGAYLKRTSDAFSELVQLHKELKISGKVKKDLSYGNVTEGTANSVIIPQEDGLANITNKESTSETQKHVDEVGIDAGAKNMVDEIERRNDAQRSKKGMGVQNGEGSVSGAVADVGGVAKKSKKKKGSDEIVATARKSEPDGDHDAIDLKEVGNEMVGGIRESKETKRKKRDKHEAERTYEIVAIAEKDEAEGDQSAVNVKKVKNEMVDGSEESKKTKRKKRDKREAERTDEIVAIVGKAEAVCDHDAFNVNKGENEMVHESEETRKPNRKKKDRHEVERSDDTVRIGKGVESRSNRQIDGPTEPSPTVQNEGQEQKKHKKKKEVKEERESSSVRSTEQRDDRIVDNVAENSDVKKHKKKQTHAAEESKNGDKVDIGMAKKKDNRKRKHERSADRGLDAEEVQRSKKKRT